MARVRYTGVNSTDAALKHTMKAQSSSQAKTCERRLTAREPVAIANKAAIQLLSTATNAVTSLPVSLLQPRWYMQDIHEGYSAKHGACTASTRALQLKHMMQGLLANLLVNTG